MVPAATTFRGKPLVEWRQAADCSTMSNIGSIGALSSCAAQPFQVGQAVSTGQVGGSGEVSNATSGSGGASAAAFSADYAMLLLARITHASADQALSLIQALSVTPLR